ncbi:beta-N-acetylhexosaminidase [Acidithiobacillus sp. HP-6]|uniref:beta-N-acetylhexosaminidase n=1 Tax=unclassified Acidithiobacillus TaxID=2614800 RepID=UPI00187AE4F5|nr:MULTISPECIES: beta-N-acetylhexosaminidase [unclassified Acidithiobacillus]MBE7562374.1 beta-N-acetylhexosaminidase [Acidithiobacillus sp. HP-6]MBE7569180.1 beta-N-acetylhexosaminidase [Acidithiobacillus sp. HP-2]MDD5279019.1 beta-N-acetylhexosaminidase [Acidithiobacillus sp.]
MSHSAEPRLLMRGPLMVDIAGLWPTPEEFERLRQPAVGGVILFARNCEDAQQVQALCQEIHALRSPPLLIGIDQEGGRVQRLKKGVTRFPPMARLGQKAEALGLEAAQSLAYDWGRLLATELREIGVDFSFTPCVDLDRGISRVIGDRAIHRNPDWVGAIAARLWQGMSDSGLQGVAKHFPGHGAVAADSHLALPRDDRPLVAIEEDLQPFRSMIQAAIPAIMPAHCLYPQIDPEQPAGFSSRWLTGVLRGSMGFTGVIVSDDLSMVGAHAAGDMSARVDAAQAAGADLLLVCNDPDGAHAAIEHLQNQGMQTGTNTLAALAGDAGIPLSAPERARCMREITELSC